MRLWAGQASLLQARVEVYFSRYKNKSGSAIFSGAGASAQMRPEPRGTKTKNACWLAEGRLFFWGCMRKRKNTPERLL